MTEILSIGTWHNNAEMIADIARLPGYLTPPNADDPPWTVLDATYGEGKFWTIHQPEYLSTNDLHKPADNAWDYRKMPVDDGSFDVVVFDPPYRLSGRRDQGEKDARYGTSERRSRADILEDIVAGALECYRVCRHRLIAKCQDQVEGGKMRWQTDLITGAIQNAGGRKADRFDLVTTLRQQPPGRRQLTSRSNHSTLLMFAK